jgi:NADH:ubiquinone oxidoreductase subunit E
MSSFFSAQLNEIIKGFLGRYETKRSSILPILHAIQDENDWISPEAVQALEAEHGLSVIDVNEVLSFYTMYRKSPPKPYRLEVCASISCWLNGAEKTMAAAKEMIAQAEKDGRPLPFECHRVECLGVCGYAPVALVNKDRHLNVTPELARKLIEEYSRKELPSAAKKCAADLKARGDQRSPSCP